MVLTFGLLLIYLAWNGVQSNFHNWRLLILGAVILVLGITAVTLAARMPSRIECPHCGKKVSANVGIWNGNLSLSKSKKSGENL